MVDNLVVDQEVVTRTFADGIGEVDVLAIYLIENGKIAKAWFKMGSLQAHANQNSCYLPRLAKVALDAYDDCKSECEKPADKHEPCKARMESCRISARECRAVLT